MKHTTIFLLLSFAAACGDSVAHEASYERRAQAMLGHKEVRALCAGWDTDNDGYESCDLLDQRTGRTYPLSCPFGLTFASECKLRGIQR